MCTHIVGVIVTLACKRLKGCGLGGACIPIKIVWPYPLSHNTKLNLYFRCGNRGGEGAGTGAGKIHVSSSAGSVGEGCVLTGSSYGAREGGTEQTYFFFSLPVLMADAVMESSRSRLSLSVFSIFSCSSL